MKQLLKGQNQVSKFSAIALFCLLASIQMMKGIKDALAIEAQLHNLQYLITGTFLVIALLTLIAKSRLVTDAVLQFVLSIGLVLGLVIFLTQPASPIINASVTYIIIGAFSLILISQFWKTLMSLYDIEGAKQAYTFIAISGSLGGILGPIISASLINFVNISASVIFAVGLLLLSNFFLFRARSQTTQKMDSDPVKGRVPGNDTTRAGIWLGTFIFIYALISTFIYVKQLEVVGAFLTGVNERALVFTLRDLFIGVVLVLLQVRMLKKPDKYSNSRLAAFPVVTLIVLALISVVPTIGGVIGAIILFKSYNYAFIRPARELFYIKTPALGNYKNTIDSLLYRAGDLFAIWLIYLLNLTSWKDSITLIFMVPVIAIWIIVSTKIQAQLKQAL